MDWLPHADVPAMRDDLEPKAGGESCGLHELIEAFRALAMAGDTAAGRGAGDATLQPQDEVAAIGAGAPAGRS